MQAIRPIRRSQLISPWGIGQMINFPKDESLMVVGLDMWEELFKSCDSPEEFIITEERLAKRLGVKDFRLPPDFREPGVGIINSSLKIPFVRFPRWHYCTRCGHMEKVSIYQPHQPKCTGVKFKTGRSCDEIAVTKRQRLIPVRFIAVCTDGHIEDFPFHQWVHGENEFDGNHSLRLRAGRNSSALSGIEISCSCGLSKTMAGAFNEGSLGGIKKNCSGGMPWLGIEEDRNNTSSCGKALQVVQKGASNVYFSQVRSSIYLPQWGSSIEKKVIEVLENNWEFLTSGQENGILQKIRFELVAERKFPKEQKNTFTDKLYEAAKARIDFVVSNMNDDSDEKYRKIEYDAILSVLGGNNQDFYVTKICSENYDDADLGGAISSGFSNVCMLHKLRETRAFVGFSRLLPDDRKTIAEKKQFIRLNNAIDWLPAIVVRGEGIFLEFNTTYLQLWASQEEVVKRTATQYDNYRKSLGEIRPPKNSLKSEFVLIHTFAHLLINQLAYECGYGSSALRERIYSNSEFPDEHMGGVLIYTASGDSEGSLGGLVRQGKPGFRKNSL